jgi:hypothetical protein
MEENRNRHGCFSDLNVQRGLSNTLSRRASFYKLDQGGSKRQAHRLSSIYTLTFEHFPLFVPTVRSPYSTDMFGRGNILALQTP